MALLVPMVGLQAGTWAAYNPNETHPASSKQFYMTEHNSIFFIGSNKAGTTSMMTYFQQLPGGWNPCHNKCDDVQWAAESHNHNKSAAVWKNHRAFMDNGDESDYQWLYRTFHGSRFIMNVRPLRDWVLSRYDMVQQIRLAGGCTGEGTVKDCPIGRLKCADNVCYPPGTGPISHWTGNSPADIRAWVVVLAKTQQEQVEFFDESNDRRNRFTMVDVTNDEDQHSSIMRLIWSARNHLIEHAANETLLTIDVVPPLIRPLDKVPGPDNIPHELNSPHSAKTIRRVEKILTSLGCKPHTWRQYLYKECADKILASRLELAQLPKEPFPNARGQDNLFPPYPPPFKPNSRPQQGDDGGTLAALVPQGAPVA